MPPEDQEPRRDWEIDYATRAHSEGTYPQYVWYAAVQVSWRRTDVRADMDAWAAKENLSVPEMLSPHATCEYS